MKKHPLSRKTNKVMIAKRKDGYHEIRVYHKKRQGSKLPRYRFKCGCCDESLEIYYDHEGTSHSLEINGVMGSIQNWRELLLPLLKLPNKTS
ncbi:MAG: hypothetical protein JSV52_12300 [Candidatus Zixiibacteriota bacterium]|nr:MAG: hypothetical protein JSV52_12300 [candidate division Zixibacteria bacterium]